MRILILILLTHLPILAHSEESLQLKDINNDFKAAINHFSYNIETKKVIESNSIEASQQSRLVGSKKENNARNEFEDLEQKYFQDTDSISTQAAAPKRVRSLDSNQ